MKNPMQSIVKDQHGRVRFKENQLVNFLLENGGLDMNRLAVSCRDMPQTDWEQFYQLIGYSLTGYHELSGVSDASALEATRLADATFPGNALQGCRDNGCGIHCGVPDEDEDPARRMTMPELIAENEAILDELKDV